MSLPVYFVHVPRSGGTSVVTWVRGRLADGELFPTGDLTRQMADKMSPNGLQAVTPEELARIRFYAPHLPVAAHELLGVEVALAALVRDPVEQMRSSLDMQSDAPTTEALLNEFDDLPNPWYSTHQLQWYFGASVDDVRRVYAQVDGAPPHEFGRRLDEALNSMMSDRDLVTPACERLTSLDLLALTTHPEPLLDGLAKRLAIAGSERAPWTNRGHGTTWPSDAVTHVEELLAPEREIYELAKSLIA